jgi:putative hemolysin
MNDSGIGFEVILILVLLIANGVFAMSEMAIVSARKTRLQQRAEGGDAGARSALELVGHPNRFLSTVQIGITLIGILAGAYGGATIAEQIGLSLAGVPRIAPYSQPIGLAIVVISITYLSLVIGELVPKRIALTHPERIAAAVARPMHLLSIAATPLVKVLSLSTDGILRLLRVRKSDDASVTEDDISALIEQATVAGILAEEEQDLVQRIFALGDRRVDAVMTPRRKIIWLDLRDALERNRGKMIEHRYSRFPVCEGGIDHIVGMVDVRELWSNELAGNALDLRANLTKPLFVPETMPALRLLELFRESRVHLALVVDEYGGTHGLVSLNDVLEEITGDLMTQRELRVKQREDGSWLVDASISMEEFWSGLGLEERRADLEHAYITLGGFVLDVLGRLPSEGESFEALGLRFEIVDMDRRRIDKLLVSTPTDRKEAGGPGSSVN